MRFCVCGLKGELNNINNISMLKPYATICGITEEEMLTQMSGHIDQMAQALGCTRSWFSRSTAHSNSLVMPNDRHTAY